jgi:hypothetical protein
MSESRGQVLWSFGFAGLGVFKDIDLLPRKEGISRGGWQPTADVLLTMRSDRQPGRNRWQRFWLVRAVFGAFPFAIGRHWLRPLGSINAPSSWPECLMARGFLAVPDIAVAR